MSSEKELKRQADEIKELKQELETAYDICAEKITKLQEKGQIDE